MKNRVVIDAPAKVNLYLEITGRRQDGYHLLDTVMHTVTLCDLLVIGRTAGSGIRVTCSRPGVPEDEGNLAHKAARLLLQSLGLGEMGLHIHIDKRTPSGAGLGGGSADAAAVLAGLCRLLDCRIPPEKLRELALPLGADVPFALLGGCARAGGVGEALSPAPGLPVCHMVIAKPPASQDTAEAYALYDRHPGDHAPGAEHLLDALSAGSLPAVAAAQHNDFTPAYLAAGHPVGSAVADICAAMAARGAMGACMTGSGSAVVGLFADAAAARACADGLPGVEAFVAAPRADGPKILWED